MGGGLTPPEEDRTAPPTPRQGYLDGHEQDREKGDAPSTSASAPVNKDDVKVRDFRKEEEDDGQVDCAARNKAKAASPATLAIKPLRVLVVEVCATRARYRNVRQLTSLRMSRTIASIA